MGAVRGALTTGRDVKLVALADLFANQFDGVVNSLKGKVGAEQVKVSKDAMFDGFDAYEKLLASGVDAVILATPQGFRPLPWPQAEELFLQNLMGELAARNWEMAA